MPDKNNHEVLEAIQDLATHMDDRFGAVDERFNTVDEQFGEVKQEIGKLRSDMIDHVARTVADAKGEIIQVIKTDRERQKTLQY